MFKTSETIKLLFEKYIQNSPHQKTKAWKFFTSAIRYLNLKISVFQI